VLSRVQAQLRRKHRPLHGAAKSGTAGGRVPDSRKMAKHFSIEIRDAHLSFWRRTEQIAVEARLDGIDVIRASVPAEHLDAEEAVQAYNDLSRVERAFRSLTVRQSISTSGRSGIGPHRGCASCLSLHVGVPCRMASAGGFGAIAVSRYRSWCCAYGTILTCSAEPSKLAKAKRQPSALPMISASGASQIS
jgi:hypothetical protein